jgi:uncharacterized protein (DUF362 family)
MVIFLQKIWSIMSLSSVTYIQNSKIRTNGEIDENNLANTLIQGLENHFAVADFRTAWRSLFSTKDVIAIKVNCLAGRGLSTTPQLVRIIVSQLEEVGIPKKNIIVFDRANRDLQRAGFKIDISNSGVRCAGNDYFGYYNQLIMHKSIGSMISNVMVEADGVINIPVLKDHGIVGMSGALKNFFGVIHNPNKYHLDVGNPYVADLCSHELIRSKTRLTICDALTAQYEAGPPFMPQFAVRENTLIISSDMVALDRIGWQRIEELRQAHDLPPLKEVGREPAYIFTAADPEHNLGQADLNKIRVNRLRL